MTPIWFNIIITIESSLCVSDNPTWKQISASVESCLAWSGPSGSDRGSRFHIRWVCSCYSSYDVCRKICFLFNARNMLKWPGFRSTPTFHKVVHLVCLLSFTYLLFASYGGAPAVCWAWKTMQSSTIIYQSIFIIDHHYTIIYHSITKLYHNIIIPSSIIYITVSSSSIHHLSSLYHHYTIIYHSITIDDRCSQYPRCNVIPY